MSLNSSGPASARSRAAPRPLWPGAKVIIPAHKSSLRIRQPPAERVERLCCFCHCFCAAAASTDARAAPVEATPVALPPVWFVALCGLVFFLLWSLPPVRASLMKYVQTGEAIVAVLTGLVVGGYTLLRRADALATSRANAASAAAAAAAEAAAAAAAAAEKDRAVLLDTNRKSGGSALWRASSVDGLRRVYAALPSVQPLPAILFSATQLHDRLLKHESYAAYAPLFLSLALDGVSLPTLDSARLEECGVRAEHAPGLAAFLVTLCQNAEV